MSDASSAMEIETTNNNNKESKPLLNGSAKHDCEDLHEKYKLTLSKINSKINQLDIILRKLNDKLSPPNTNNSNNNKYNTRKRKSNNVVADYDPSDDFVIPSTKRKSVTSSPIPSTTGGRRSRRSSSASVSNNIKSPRRVQRTSSRRRPSQPLHPNVIEALEFGHKIIQDLRKHKLAYPFLSPVDPVALKIPDYFDVIKEPMDLGTVKERLESNFYGSVQEFIEDTRLIWSNAMLYNRPDSDVHQMAKTLSEIFEEHAKKAIEIAEKTSEETINEYKEKIASYEEMIADYDQKIREIRDQMPKDAIPIIEVKKIKSTAKTNRPMHYEEKVRLAKIINELDEKYYSGIISIIEQEIPDSLKTDNEELELDIDELEPFVLWRIDDFINTYVTTIPKETESIEVKSEPQTSDTKTSEVTQTEEVMNDDSSSSDSDSESSDSDSDSDDDSSMDASRNVLVSKTEEASVSNGTTTTTTVDRSLEVPSIVQAEVDVKSVEIQNADSWSKFNVSEENTDTSSKNDAFDKDNKESDPLWQEFLNRGKQNLQREKTKAEQEEKLRKERELKEQQERERIQREEEEKRERERQLEEDAKKKREEEIRKRREEERRRREQEMNQMSDGGLMESLY